MLNAIKYRRVTSKTPEEAILALKSALADRRFGVLWELNFKDKLKEKGVETDVYFHLLEICNPQKAKEALEIDLEMGFFLPCRAVVYVKDSKTMMGIMKPSVLLETSGNKDLLEMAKNVEAILIEALNEAGEN